MPTDKLTEEILSLRGRKNEVDPMRPYAFLQEQEYARSKKIEQIATVFLTNRECPYRCLMCDLWKNTTDYTVPESAIPTQIQFALDQLAADRECGTQKGRPTQIKLYNSGNFFDQKAIPKADFPAIIRLLNGGSGSAFSNVIVENHPKLCTAKCVDFKKQIDGRLEVAIGLETIHPTVLPRLNKGMTLDDYRRAVEFLVDNEIFVRTFILLRPPYLSEDEGIHWAVKSIEFAYSNGVECCAVIPTRTGNGALDKLLLDNKFAEPKLSSLETVLSEGLKLAGNDRRCFVDLWDAERFSDCVHCCKARIQRLSQMNVQQNELQQVECSCQSTGEPTL